MPLQLFASPRVPFLLKSFSPGTEKRHGETTKIVTLTLRCESFDAELASSIDEGLGSSTVKPALFNLTDGEPKDHLESVDLSLGCPRQNLRVFAAPDLPDARLAILQAKVVSTTATKRDDAFDLVVKVSFGPVGRDELEFLQHWFTQTQFVSFEESEPALFDVSEAVVNAVANMVEVEPIDGRPLPTWEDGEPPVESDEAREVGSRPTARRHAKAPKTSKANGAAAHQ